MAYWTDLPQSGFGWSLWALGLAIQAIAVVVIVRDLRSRRLAAGDVAALIFVTVLGPGAAILFLIVHDVLAARARRKTVATAARAAEATTR